MPECDVIGFATKSELKQSFVVMRPDEALIMARMLIDAVREVTSGYEIDDAASMWTLNGFLR